jgi:hypothetical protein
MEEPMGHRRWMLVVTMSCAITIGACSKSEPPPDAKPAPAPPAAAPAPAAAPFRVVSVDLGKQIGADKKVTQPTTAFAPTDTIYASVVSEGAASSVALKARWTYEDGQLVNESAQTIAPTGPSVTEFHIAKPSGWPTGSYKVEISANDKVVGAKEFSVQ